MKSTLAIVGFIFFLLLQPQVCSAQDQALRLREAEARKAFDEAANQHDPDLIFKALWYSESPVSYYELELYTTGVAYTARVVYDWAVQASHSGILSAAQLNEIKRLLAELKPPETTAKSQAGQKYMVFVYVNGDKYVRSDFAGDSVPGSIENIIKRVDAEMSEESLRPDKFPRLDAKIVANPCAKREGDVIDLEAMSSQDIMTYSFRRSLLPPDRYRAIKCYLQKSPNDNSDYGRFLRTWAEKYESGSN